MYALVISQGFVAAGGFFSPRSLRLSTEIRVNYYYGGSDNSGERIRINYVGRSEV